MDAKEDSKLHFYSQKSKLLSYKTCGKQKATKKTSEDMEIGSTTACSWGPPWIVAPPQSDRGGF